MNNKPKLLVGRFVGSLLVAGWLLAACSDTTPTQSALSTTITNSPTTTVPVPSQQTTTLTTSSTTAFTTPEVAPTTIRQPTPPTTTTTSGTSPNSSPTVAVANPSSVDVSSKLFIDNRSDPVDLIRSFYNAVNRKEYVRAYGYWNNPGQSGSSQPQAYQDFAKGYADTAEVQLSTSTVAGGVAAGTEYFRVPFILKSTSTAGVTQIFVGCYVMGRPNPADFGTPPFRPLQLDSAVVQNAAATANFDQLMAQSCQKSGISNNPITYKPAPTSDAAVEPSFFLDDRSSPAEVLRSYYNAVNRHEYVRAYSYWEHAGTSATSEPPAYKDFAQGYASTTSVQLTTGTVSSQGAAGTIYYQVPVTVQAKHSDGSSQTFVGCYTLRQPQPANFGTPPFQPMGIYSGKVQLVATSANPSVLMGQACSG